MTCLIPAALMGPFTERLRQTVWVLEYLDDIDADFLAVYRIDLRDPATRISGPTFFARASRLFSYRGAMRERLLVEQEENRNNPPARSNPGYTPPAAAAPAASDDGVRWVNPDDMKALFPDLF